MLLSTPASGNLVSATPPINILFVYGTLLTRYVPQSANALHPPTTLRTATRLGGVAKLRSFELCDLGRYPCIVRSDNRERTVTGELYILAKSEDWRALDKYEGISADDELPYEYRRETVLAEMHEKGTIVTAQTYIYNRDDADTLPRIAGGDYVKYYNAKSRLNDTPPDVPSG